MSAPNTDIVSAIILEAWNGNASEVAEDDITARDIFTLLLAARDADEVSDTQKTMDNSNEDEEDSISKVEFEKLFAALDLELTDLQLNRCVMHAITMFLIILHLIAF